MNSAENVGWVDYWARWLDESYGGDFEQINLAGGWIDAYPPSSAFSPLLTIGRSQVRALLGPLIFINFNKL